MNTYRILTLGQLIDALAALDDAPVRGLSGFIHSHRSWYERNATDPTSRVEKASVLAALYRSVVGTQMPGYNSGEVTVLAENPIYYAAFGESGPYIIGIEPGEDGVHTPVLLADEFAV
ncbi:hypothetical protein [Mycolicibacterium aubagnense]|uniref:Uncharacterized protein n=1 Tax=Mycolicibacterium aubagnense TaxID=319707 RepID=A0ABN5YL18_9MYCO|nr:hypothetical protein [Mycolicibacterium aubagnense]TLH49147.1 hypothetical protein C1S80_28785 [Mycolicibacterium aubagnense]BBX82258.1 hypothetical protein MAUB_01310 [Mycolicibacterium aubagnense]